MPDRIDKARRDRALQHAAEVAEVQRRVDWAEVRDVIEAARKVDEVLRGASRIAMDFPATPKTRLREALERFDSSRQPGQDSSKQEPPDWYKHKDGTCPECVSGLPDQHSGEQK